MPTISLSCFSRNAPFPALCGFKIVDEFGGLLGRQLRGIASPLGITILVKRFPIESFTLMDANFSICVSNAVKYVFANANVFLACSSREMTLVVWQNDQRCRAFDRARFIVFQQATRTGVIQTLMAVLPSCPLANKRYGAYAS